MNLTHATSLAGQNPDLPVVTGISRDQFRIERASYHVRNSQYVAEIEAYVAPEIVRPGSSILLNERDPISIANNRTRFAVILHPGVNSTSVTRVGIRGEVLQWFIEIKPQGDWRVSESCDPYGALWKNLEVPAATHFEVSCKPDLSDPSKTLIFFDGNELKSVSSLDHKEFPRSTHSSAAAWEISAQIKRPLEMPIEASFGPSQLRAKAKLWVYPPLKFGVHFQIAGGYGSLSVAQTGLQATKGEPRAGVGVYAPFFRGHFEGRLDASAGTLEVSIRPQLRWLPRDPRPQPQFAPFVDLSFNYSTQLVDPFPLRATSLFLPLPGLGFSLQLTRSWSMALTGHGMFLKPSLAGDSFESATTSIYWDVGLWLAWVSNPDSGKQWFARSRYASFPIGGGYYSNGSWSTLSFELGWGGTTGPWQKGGLGVGI